ncbi:MAG: hypothetical protein LUE29_02470 [Lachnospiraceae bacterium]|nr:hypothetical protein [Lachnospiraceae bacterium]
MLQNHSEAEHTEKSGEENLTGGNAGKSCAKKDSLFFRIGEIAEKIWKNKWYQWFLTALLVLALGSGAFAYRYIEQETSVDSVIEDYMQRFSAGDWEGMYEASGAGEAGILYSVWETAMSAGRTNSIDSYTYKLTGTESGIQYYTITYREKKSEEDQTLEIALQETGEVVYHFFKTYEVTAAPLVITGATVTVPEGITFTFDSLSSEELEAAEEEAGIVYALPALMAGEYEVYLSGDTVEDQVCTVTVGKNSRYFTWLDFEMEEDIAEAMEEHLAEVVLSVLSEAVTYGDEMERDYGSMIGETYGHDGMSDWNALGTAISDSLKLKVTEADASDGGTGDENDGDSSDGETGDENGGDSFDGDTGDENDADSSEENAGDESDTDTNGAESKEADDGADGEEAEEAEILEVTELTVNDSETSSYDFVYPDRCTVKLVLECSYTAASMEIDILDPDAEEEQTRTGTIHMEFVAAYLVDAEEWQILDCTCTSSYTMDEPAEEETEEAEGEEAA